MQLILTIFIATLGIPLFFGLYIFLTEHLVKVTRPAKSRFIRPWLWLFPALFFLVVFLVYPIINTFILSFKSADTSRFVGLDNYASILSDSAMLEVLKNNLLWVFFFTSMTVVLGLLFAVLTDRVPYESVAKAIIFLPMAISFVAAGVIWKFMYEYAPAGEPQIGTINGLATTVLPHFEPQAWLINREWNNFALIAVGIWMQTGFAVVIFSAGLKSISSSILEAAQIDGAGGFKTLLYITLPLMSRTITVVATIMVINVLKIFDIVYVMTSGSFGSSVIAYQMYLEMFINHNFGKASAIAVLLLLVIIPAIIINMKKFGKRAVINA